MGGNGQINENPSTRSDLPPIRTCSRCSIRLPKGTALFQSWVVRTYNLRKQKRNQARARMEVSFLLTSYHSAQGCLTG